MKITDPAVHVAGDPMMAENQYMPKPWTLPPNYGGAHWDRYWVFLGRNRDSDILTGVNFDCALSGLREHAERVGEPAPEVARENHWACGWVEWIAIHPDAPRTLDYARTLAVKLDQHPRLDDDKYSELCYEETLSQWDSMTMRDRIHYCEKYGESIFAARRDCPPDGVSQWLNDHVF